MRDYHQRNAERIRAKVKEWRQANPERKKKADAEGRRRRREVDLEGERKKARERARQLRARAVRAVSDSRCECGCGERTFFSSRPPYEPLRFITGHNNTTKGRRLRVGPDFLPEERGHGTPCWIWQHGTNDQGYGQVQEAGLTKKAHRWIYEQRFGPVPEGRELHHLCEQTSCVNPEHLVAVTRREHRRLHSH